MSNIQKILLTLLLALTAQSVDGQQPNDKLIGIWEPANKEKHVLVEVFEDEKGQIAGKIIGAYDAKGVYRTAPEAYSALLFSGFSYTNDGKWKNGTFTDPEDGSIYDGRITMLGKNKLEVRAYWGFLWKDMEWVKADAPRHTYTSLK